MLISGCHRSGTSLLAGICAAVVPQQREGDLAVLVDNPTGYFESQRIRNFNDKLLQLCGHSWHRPPLQPLSWTCGERMQVLLNHRPTFADQALANDWVDKDPRLCITFGAFEHLLLKREPLALCIRNPLEVAQSLQHRDGIQPNQGLLMWYLYNRHGSRHLRQHDLVLLYQNLIASFVFETKSGAVKSLWAWLQNHLHDRSLLPESESDFHTLLKGMIRPSLNRAKTNSEITHSADKRLVDLCQKTYQEFARQSDSSNIAEVQGAFDPLPGWLVDHYDQWMRQGEPDLEYLRQQALKENQMMARKPMSSAERIKRRISNAIKTTLSKKTYPS